MKLVKLLGLAVATVAMLALAASSALASPQFMAEAYPVTWSGEETGDHVFDSGFGETICKSAEFTGSAESAQNELQVTPKYDECTTSGFSTEVDMNGCKYNLDQPSEGLTGTFDIVCPPSEKIEISVAGICKVRIGPQTNISGLSYANSEEMPTTVTAAANATGLKGETSGFFCGSGSFENGAYSGSVEVSAESGGKQVSGAVGEVSIGVPAELKFAKKDEKLSYEIKNKGTVNFKVTSYIVAGSFQTDLICPTKDKGVIKAGGSCVEKVTCTALPSIGYIEVFFSYGTIKSTLKCG
jgi:hypothetical protein